MPNTREKLINLLSTAGWNLFADGIQSKRQIADHLIANGVTVQEWISVKDRLPESGKCVLVYSGSGMVAEGRYSAYDKKWAQFRWNVKDLEVTHWMPLPQPPKGE